MLDVIIYIEVSVFCKVIFPIECFKVHAENTVHPVIDIRQLVDVRQPYNIKSAL